MIIVSDYIGHSDENGEPMGHPIKVVNETVELLKDVTSVGIAVPEHHIVKVSPCSGDRIGLPNHICAFSNDKIGNLKKKWSNLKTLFGSTQGTPLFINVDFSLFLYLDLFARRRKYWIMLCYNPLRGVSGWRHKIIERVLKRANAIIVTKAGLGYTIGNYLLKGLSFFTIPIFARLMSTADYGIFNTYASYEGIFYVIVGLTLHSSFKNAKYKYKDQFNSYISSCVAIGLISLAAWLVLGNLFAPLFERYAGFSRMIVNLLLLNSFGTAVIQYYNTYIGIDYRYKDFIKIAALNAISSIGVSILLMVTLMQDDRANARIIGMAAPVIVITIFLIRGFFCKAKPTWNREYRSFALSYSLPIIPHGLAQVVLAQFDRIMIRSMVGASEAGIYSFGYNIYSLVKITATSLENVWSPWFYEKMNAGEEETIRKQGNKYAFGMLLFSTSVIFFAPEAISILGTADYHDAVYIVIPVVIAGFFAFLYTLPIQVEYYYGKTKSIAAATLVAALMNIMLNFFKGDCIFVPADSIAMKLHGKAQLLDVSC